MPRLPGYPSFFYPLLIATFVTLAITGLMLIPTLLEFRLELSSPVQINGDLRLASVASHSASAFLMVFLVGSLSSIHMRAGWVRRQNRTSGVLLLTSLLVLCVSAIGIFYLGDETLSRISSVTHTLTGCLWVLLFLGHGLTGYQIYRRRLRKKHQRGGENRTA